MSRSILVKIGGKSLPCEVKGPGECPYCQQPVICCMTPRDERIAVELFTADDTHVELHSCRESRRHRARGG
jgi:hypothetical protein